jgi:hypothetical protein
MGERKKYSMEASMGFDPIPRRGWDSNPRSLKAKTVFKTVTLNHSVTPPSFNI